MIAYEAGGAGDENGHLIASGYCLNNQSIGVTK